MKTTIATIVLAGLAAGANAQIAGENFDGGSLNLINSTVPALDGGPGDYFGVGSLGAWPQGFPNPGVPFSLTDDTVADVSGGGVFPTDNEGVFGQNRSKSDAFFALSDSDEFGTAQTASWTFDVSGGTNLAFSVDFGGISSSSFSGYALGSFVEFRAVLDGNTLGTVVRFDAVDGSFSTRPMDSGIASGGGRLLQASGSFGVTKFSADTGLAVADLFSDKATVAGGLLDTFSSGVFSAAGGSTLEIVMVADMPFEAAAFDNISITPTPATAALLGMAGLVSTRRRRA